MVITLSPLRPASADRHSPVLHGVLHLRQDSDVEMMSAHCLSHERRSSLQERPTVKVHCDLYRCLSHKCALGADNVKGPYFHHFSHSVSAEM